MNCFLNFNSLLRTVYSHYVACRHKVRQLFKPKDEIIFQKKHVLRGEKVREVNFLQWGCVRRRSLLCFLWKVWTQVILTMKQHKITTPTMEVAKDKETKKGRKWKVNLSSSRVWTGTSNFIIKHLLHYL